jgi:hypothetical protein
MGQGVWLILMVEPPSDLFGVAKVSARQVCQHPLSCLLLQLFKLRLLGRSALCFPCLPLFVLLYSFI